MKVKLGNDLLRPLSLEQIHSLTRDQLITMLVAEQSVRLAFQEELDATKTRYAEISNQAKALRNMLFGSRSERRSRSTSDKSSSHGESGQQQESDRSRGNTGRQLPSERYPNAEVQEQHIFPEGGCSCGVCGHALEDSGLSEISEHLSVIPKRFIVIRQYRHKFRCCQCHGTLETAPNPARVIPRSSYSDDLVIDVTVSKYCDLIPIERYTKIAERQGFQGIPPHSLIELSIQLGFFLRATFERLKREVLDSLVIHADETPHRMLEGDARKTWFLWVFMNSESCIYECHNSRSGDVAAELLKAAGCEIMVSDVYSGYKKAVREANWRISR